VLSAVPWGTGLVGERGKQMADAEKRKLFAADWRISCCACRG